MDPLIVNRVFEEIDQIGIKMEKLSKITYQNSATLGILSKLVILIIGFLVVAGVTASYNMVKNKYVPIGHAHAEKAKPYVEKKINYPIN